MANLLAAPAVGPATVLGLLGGLPRAGGPSAGRVVGAGAGWCVAWIVLVAQSWLRAPTPAVGWGSGPVALVLLTLLCLAVAVAGPRLVSRRTSGLAGCTLLVVAVLVPGAHAGLAP